MNLYDKFMAPLEKRKLIAIRKQLLPKASGDVLELGAGTGVNFKYYNADTINSFTVVDKITNEVAANRAPKRTSFVKCDAIAMPFDDNSFDTVVETLVMCSIDDTQKALDEITRILRPGGLFLHLDHGMPNTSGLRSVFNFIAPLWRGLTRSCRINKNHKYFLEKSTLITLEEHSTSSGIFYWGVSKKGQN